MKIRIAAVIVAIFVSIGAAYAADNGKKVSSGDFGKKTVSTVTDTAQSAVKGTANIAKTSVNDTIAAPKTAIQAVKDTANTAFSGMDAAIKPYTDDGR